jgi:NADPH:quinone reductase-like Zn-dependent oxidoreductase
LLAALVLSRFVSQKMVFFIAKVNQGDLTILGEFMATGRVTPVIDKRYRLSELPEALRYAAEGHSRGKLIVIPDI